MNRNEQIDLFKEFTKQQLDILIKKSKDYSGDFDVLSNFKKVANIRGTEYLEPILVLINTKIVRLNNLLGKKEPKNESIDDTLIDLCNYVFLLYCLLGDKETME